MLALIAAVARNRAIGKANQLLWHLPEDMRHFRETTRGKTVIMGRKTWESLPDAFRPLPGRRNIVVSRNAAYPAKGAETVTSLTAAVALTAPEEEIFVIGGAEIYREALPLAQKLYLTEVAASYEADAYFPELDAAQWREISRQRAIAASAPGCDFVVYQRRGEARTTDFT